MGLFRRRTTPRQPVADLQCSLEVGGQVLALDQVLVAARVEDGRLHVVVHHPSFPDLGDQDRLTASVEILLATLGEDALHRVVAEVSPATHPPIDPFGLTALREFVRSLGVAVDPAEA